MAMYVPDPLNGGDVLRVTYSFELDEQVMLMVLHARVSAGSVNTYISDLEAIAEKLAADCLGATGIGEYRVLQSNEVFWRTVRVQRIYPVRDVYFESIIGTVGADAGIAAPPNIALTIAKRTLRPDRHGTGDTHFFGFPQSKLAGGLWDTTLVANLNSQIEPYLTAEYDPGAGLPALKWCLFDPEPTTGGPQDIIGTNPSFRAKTMHRRTVGLGE